MSLDPRDEDALRAALRRRAEAAVVDSNPDAAIQRRAVRLRARRSRTRWAVTLAPVLILAGVVFAATRAPATHRADLATQPSGTYRGSETTLDPAVSIAQLNAPKPSYSEPLRTQVRDTFNQFSDCMRANGVPDYPQLPDNFGDGSVAQPVATDSPGDQAALAACASQHDALTNIMVIANGHPEQTIPSGR